MHPPEFASRLAAVRARIAAAAQRAGRDPASVTLVAVSKTQPPAAVRAAFEAGLRDFGENRLAELADKQVALGLPGARWHMIGHVQRRKARDLVGRCTLLHALDRLALAEELSRRFAAEGQCLEALLQVNSSGEASKGGWDVTTPAGMAHLVAEVVQVAALPGLRLRGLMTMAPFVSDPEAARPHFTALRALQGSLAEQFPALDWSMLSMGMSNDFEVAVEEGATHVRVGTALFGERA